MLVLFWLGLALLALLAFRLALRRANELFVLEARQGKLHVLRGRLPPSLFSELAEIAARESADAAQIRVVSESGLPRLIVNGSAQRSEQAMRNVLGRYNVAQIRAGRLAAP